MTVSLGTTAALPTFLDGIAAADVAEILDRLETRSFPAGSIVIAEGDFPRCIYLTESGTAQVEVADQALARIAAGTTIGEMSLFTGQPAAATVRAVDELVVRPIGERELERIASEHPQVYRNVAAILAGRLASTNRLAVRRDNAVVAVIRTGSPIAAYALACSIAWHTREPTALLVAGSAAELEPFARAEGRRGDGAHVVFDELDDGVVESLARRYPHVLVLPRGSRVALPEARTVDLPEGAIDGTALREGVAQGGRELGRIARDVAGLTVGLALGAGSLRGYAHAGVLRGLERIGLEPDYIAGASIGSAVAGAYACEYDATTTEKLLDGCARTLFRPTIPIRGFMSSAPLGRYLKEVYHGARLEDLARPLGVVTADLPTRREVVLRRGPLWRAVLASVSIPGVYPAQRIGGYTLVDGGVVNSVPSGVVADMGADQVIAVRLLGPSDEPELDGEVDEASVSRPPTALAALLSAIEIMQGRTAREGGPATVTIAPDLSAIPGAKLRNFSQGKRYVEAGEAAFEAALPRIASVLPWVRS